MHLRPSVFVFALALTGVLSAEIGNNSENKSDFKKSLEKECSQSYSTTCFKLDVVQWVEKLNEPENFSILPGMTVVRDKNVQEKPNEVVAELAREFPNDPDARLDAYLMKKVTNFLGSHSLKLNLFDPKSVEDYATARKGGFGGGKGGKKGGGLGIILAMGAMMKGTLMALALGGIAAIAGKALMAGLVSLLLSGIIGLKALTSGGHHTTYEVVAKPIHTSHHTHHEEHAGHGGHGSYGHSSYGRSFDDPLPAGLQSEFKPY